MTKKGDIDFGIAFIEDIQGIFNILKQNLIKISEIDEISKKQRRQLEKEGFLRKEVDIQYYKKLIKNPNTEIYVAKNHNDIVIGFMNIFRKKYNIRKVRNVIGNLSVENESTKDLLFNEEKEFAYLDQVSILPKFKRKGIGTALFQSALLKLDTPVVAFIVEKPILNKASIYWHEFNGFEFSAINNAEYKGELFTFQIYIHWNNKK